MPVATSFNAAAIPPPRKNFFNWIKSTIPDAIQSERNLLSLCKTSLDILNTPIDPIDRSKFIHSIIGGSENAVPIVCMQGYGAGAAIFYKNIDFLCENMRMYAVDWLGTGLSGRPKFLAKTTREAENFFIDSLARWKERIGLKKFILMGHSLGGYLATLYAKRYPHHVMHLILVSPAGVAKRPDNYKVNPLFESSWTWQSQVYNIAKCLLNSGMTPQMFVRAIGPFGPKIINDYVDMRFKNNFELSQEESSALQHYFYHITVAEASGEHALRYIFFPFAWARDPLEDRINDLKVPLTFIYGQRNDWMDSTAAWRITQKLNELNGPTHIDMDREVVMIPNSGHFLFLEEPEKFNNVISKILAQYLRSNDNFGESSSGNDTKTEITIE